MVFVIKRFKDDKAVGSIDVADNQLTFQVTEKEKELKKRLRRIKKEGLYIRHCEKKEGSIIMMRKKLKISVRTMGAFEHELEDYYLVRQE